MCKVISKHIYQGIRSGNKINQLTKEFYQAKIFGDKKSTEKLQRLALKELEELINKEKIELITSVNTRVSKRNFPTEIAKYVAQKTQKPYREVFKQHNRHLRKGVELKDKRVLVIDDVIFSGKTMRSVRYLLNQAQVKKCFFYTLLHSKNFKV